MTKRNNLSLYVHWPFCKSRCTYCDFKAFPNQEKRMGEYTEALLREIDGVAFEDNPIISTLYFGGGTPSHVPMDYLKRVRDALFNTYDCSALDEFTMEANPEDITEEWIQHAIAMGVNRVSLGVQSFDDRILAVIGRDHSGAQAVRAVQLLTAGGIDNISIDLMIGLPGQTMESVDRDLHHVATLPLQHVSVYSLTIAEKTRMHRQKVEGMEFPSEKKEREMFHHTRTALEDLGFARYEIANFAQPGFESKHNLCYWHLNDYYGFGLAAASFIHGAHEKNTDVYQAYLRGEGKEREVLSNASLYTEILLSGLRLTEGVNPEILAMRTGITPDATQINAFQDQGLLQAGTQLKCTTKGMDLMDQVLIGLMPAS